MNRKLGFLIILLFLVGISTVTPKVQTVEARGTIYIRADGSIDPSTALISTVDNVTYTFTGDISDSIVVERDNIVVDGKAYAVQGNGAFDSMGIYLAGRSEVTIKNTNIKVFSYGIWLDHCSNNSVSGNNIANNEYGIYLRASSDNGISGNEVANNDYGIYLNYYSNSNNVSGNNVRANNNDGIYLNYYSNSNNVSGNNVRANGNDGIRLDDSSNNSVSGNNIANNEYGLYLGASSDNSISGNNITANNKFYGMWLSSSSNCSVSGNNITANNGYGVSLSLSSNNSVRGNNIAANDYYGIWLYSSSNNSVSGNAFFNDGLVVGDSYENVVVDNLVNSKPLVYLEDVSDHVIEDAGQVILVKCNRISVESLNLSHTAVGIELWQTNNTKISGNNITANNDSGIYLNYYSNSNNVSGNNVRANGNDGIRLDDSSNNSVSGNNIANNEYGLYLGASSDNSISGNNIIGNDDFGIWLTYSSNNSVYNNNFVNNTQQVGNVYSRNTWDDGYPSGGNYWSDYAGIDSNHDGIGDTPYVVDADNTDHYPLIAQYIIPEFPIFFIIPLFMMATPLVVVVHRRKHVQIE